MKNAKNIRQRRGNTDLKNKKREETTSGSTGELREPSPSWKSIRSTRWPRISAAHWKLQDLPSEISAEFVEEELNLKSNSQLQFEFPNYAFAIIKLCKIETREVLFFFFSFLFSLI